MHPDEYRNSEDSEAVYWFSSPFDALNNWSAHAITAFDKSFPTLEHAYHYSKFYIDNPDIAEQVFAAKSPLQAKQIATNNKDKVRKDWFEANLKIMEDLFLKKVKQHDDVREILQKTGDRVIVENSPWDTFWGVGKAGDGENHMGKIQMKVRDEMRKR